MATIKCMLCGKGIPSDSVICPYCGGLSVNVLDELNGEIVTTPTRKATKQPSVPLESKSPIDATKAMIAEVEKTLDQARKASGAFEVASKKVEKLSEESINLNGEYVHARMRQIIEEAVNACDNLYKAYQKLIVDLDKSCSPYLKSDPNSSAIKAVEGTIKWLNEESKIENNYAVHLNGSYLGRAVQAKYLPSDKCKELQKKWEKASANLPDLSAAKKAWEGILANHKKLIPKVEDEAIKEAARQEESKAKEKLNKNAQYHKQYAEKIRARKIFCRPAAGLFDSDADRYAYINGDGRAVFKGYYLSLDQGANPGDVSGMHDLCQIGVTNSCVVGLTRSGDVVLSRVGKNELRDKGYGVCSSWHGIKKIAAGSYGVIALRYDGTCVGTKFKSNTVIGYSGFGNVESWTNVVDIVCGYEFSAGLKEDGTVLVAGVLENAARVRQWKKIALLYVCYDILIGITDSGEILHTGNGDFSYLAEAKGIVSLARYGDGVAALQYDGTVFGVGKDKVGHNIGKKLDVGGAAVALFKVDYDKNLLVLREDGKLIEFPGNHNIKKIDNQLQLIKNYSSYQEAENNRIIAEEEKSKSIKLEKAAAEEKRKKEEAIRAERRSKNLCQHCGGELEKKLFGWKCKSCGQKKDY